jgi:hypothetical protein
VARLYDPNAIRERLEAEQARVVGNLAGYRKQVARMDRPPTLLLTEAIGRERRRLDQIDLELGVNVTRWPDHAGRAAASGPKLSHI